MGESVEQITQEFESFLKNVSVLNSLHLAEVILAVRYKGAPRLKSLYSWQSGSQMFSLGLAVLHRKLCVTESQPGSGEARPYLC